MTRDEYLQALRENAHSFGDAVRVGSFDARVPSCPEWSLRQLATHLGRHYRWVRANLTRAPADGPQPMTDLESPPDDAGLADWVERGASELAIALENADLDAPCWTFGPSERGAFWCRRTAHESAMHRWDAERAVAEPAPIEANLAADGIGEFLSILKGFRGEQLARLDARSLHFHCTDVEGEWLVRLDADGMHVTPEHAKGDVAARAPASDVILMILGRIPVADVEVFGDVTVLDEFLTKSNF
jgi:uncharacterized protein (TIGR03083 family)